MSFRGCCPPLALPRTHLGGEIIGIDPKTGQFVQAAAGPPAHIVEYPYYAKAGIGRTGLGSMGNTLAWVGIGAVAILSLYFVGKEFMEQARQGR